MDVIENVDRFGDGEGRAHLAEHVVLGKTVLGPSISAGICEGWLGSWVEHGGRGRLDGL